MWEGGDCWIFGGGPSVPVQFGVPEDVIQKVREGKLSANSYSEYMESIYDKHVIGINAAYLIGNWMDLIFFGDKRFFLNNAKNLTEYPAPIVTCHNFFSGGKYSWVKYLEKDNRKPDGISGNSGKISWNQNSGAAAISVAANAGAKRIILLGFDMTLNEEGDQHWHNLYKRQAPNPTRKRKGVPFHRHLRGFARIAIDAKERGVEIINASPNSMITQFPKCSVKDLL